MVSFIKSLFGITPSVDEIVAPLSRIAQQLKALQEKHRSKISDHEETIRNLRVKQTELDEAATQATKVMLQLNNLLGA